MTAFSAQVKNWTAKAQRNGAMVHRQAVRHLYDGLIALTPVLTGNARRSWALSTVAMPVIRPGVEFTAAPDVTLEIANIELGKTAYIGGQAEYLPRLNWGFTGTDSLGRKYNQAGRFFLEQNAAKWPQYVARAAREVGE